MFDLLIKGGTVIDGSGAAHQRADVAIQKDRIVVIDSLENAQAAQTIDATGKIVAPGFIDVHSHADYTLPAIPTADSKVYQGVTTEVTGNCGISSAPLSLEMQKKGDANSILGNFGLSWDWDTFGNYLDLLKSCGTSVNVVPLVGHGTIREKTMGMSDADPTSEQLKMMKKDVRQAMKEGAFGLSTGLIYPPNVYSKTEEIIALAKIVAEEGGLYTSHIRDESSLVLEAIDEALLIGRKANIPVEISHLKTSGRANWAKMPQVIEKIRNAREQGMQVGADMYPYTASATVLTAKLPAWAMVDGSEALMKRLTNPQEREKIRQCLAEETWEGNPKYWERVLITYCGGHPEYEGCNIYELSLKRHISPEETVMDVLIESNINTGMVSFGMSDENVELGLQQDFVIIGSDGEGRIAEGPLALGRPHPRNYGTFARVLGYYSREKELFSLETAVHKMTGLSAQRFGIKERGLLKPGYFADVVIFNSETVIDKATFIEPHQYATGIEWVLVNGRPVIKNSRHTGALPGKILSR